FSTSASLAARAASLAPENVPAIPSTACRFHAAIIVWWMPCFAANSASVWSPRIASSATFALNSALYRFLVVFIPVLPQVGISLTPCPNFRDHLNLPRRERRSGDLRVCSRIKGEGCGGGSEQLFHRLCLSCPIGLRKP